jgi:penicillin-binding protein 1C
MRTRVTNWIIRRKYILLTLAVFLSLYLRLLHSQLFHDPLSTVIYDSQGELLGARVASDGQWRFSGNAQVSEKIKKTTLAFEDRYFYYHPGFNPYSICRAIVLNLKRRRIISGGSTITMQTIRLARKGKPRSVYEKLVEVLLSTRLELKKSKDEILALYTANAPYGGNVIGVEAAAWRYYGTDSKNLSWAEAATLSILPNAPSLINPGKNRDRLLKKRNLLLTRLFTLGWIDKTTYQLALSEPIPDKPLAMPKRAPQLLDRLGSLKEQDYHTTIDGKLQDRAVEIVDKHHKILQYNQIHNAAVLIVEVETGNIIAYVGNVNTSEKGNNGTDVDIIRSPRSTGSILKPALYAAMLDDGKILPNSLVADIPINLSGFAPQNFNGLYEGAVPASQALSRSLNIPAVEMLRDYGTDRFHQLLKSLGLSTLTHSAEHYGLSLILGGAEGNLEELTNLYTSFSRVLNHYGTNGLYYSTDFRPLNLLYGKKHAAAKGREEPDRVSAGALWFTYAAMNEVNRPEEESGWKYFGSSQKIAWKTGTSFGYRDGWAIGTSPRYVAGVWIGNADGEGRPGLTGISVAAPVLFELFGILPESGWFKEPVDELVPAVICRQSGFLAGPNCFDRDSVKVHIAGLHAPVCPFHRMIHLSDDGKFRVNRDCMDAGGMIQSSWFVLPPVQEWYYHKIHPEYRLLPPYKAGCGSDNAGSMDLIYPRENSGIFIPVELSGNMGRVIFEAVHRDEDASIYWHLDGKFIACTHYMHQVEILPSPGKHTLVLVDENGEELTRHFKILSKEDDRN